MELRERPAGFGGVRVALEGEEVAVADVEGYELGRSGGEAKEGRGRERVRIDASISFSFELASVRTGFTSPPPPSSVYPKILPATLLPSSSNSGRNLKYLPTAFQLPLPHPIISIGGSVPRSLPAIVSSMQAKELFGGKEGRRDADAEEEEDGEKMEAVKGELGRR